MFGSARIQTPGFTQDLLWVGLAFLSFLGSKTVRWCSIYTFYFLNSRKFGRKRRTQVWSQGSIDFTSFRFY